MSTQAQSGNRLQTLMETLDSEDGLLRESARASLVAMGAAAAPALIQALQGGPSTQVRWEAAKALGSLKDARAIPALLAALADEDTDIAWLAAEALRNLGKAAWPALLQKLVEEGANSVILRQGAHHIFAKQWEQGYNDLLLALVKALGDNEPVQAAPMLAQEMLARLRAGS